MPRPRGSSRRPGSILLLPGADGALAGVLFGLESADEPDKDRFLPGRLPGLLPAGTYRFANAPHDTRLAALAFALGAYRFTRYRKAEASGAQLDAARRRRRRRRSAASPRACALARDLINTPANDMGPAELEDAARDARRRSTAPASASIVGDELLQAELPADPRGRPRRRRARRA